MALSTTNRLPVSTSEYWMQLGQAIRNLARELFDRDDNAMNGKMSPTQRRKPASAPRA